MRGMVLMVSALIVLAGAVATSYGQAPEGRDGGAGAGADPGEAADAKQARLEFLLGQWAKQSSRLQSLDITLKRTDKSPAWGQDELYEGRALFRSPNRAWLDFKKVVVDEKKQEKSVPHERIICTGQEVWQYRSDTWQIFIYPLDRKVQKRALEEGPLPFLFNFKADEAKQRYTMKLRSEGADHYWIDIHPLLPIDQESFSLALVQLDRKFLLPTRVYLIAPNGKDSKDFVLSHIKPNTDVSEENFKGQLLPAPWKVVRNDEAEAPGPAPAAKAATPVAPAQAQGRAPMLGRQPRRDRPN